ncbi:MAG TPA: hypothetical protein DCM07_26125 [Planctomycetaceae bacterium]|nr:hypothetical protein [Gimesia sp.]HAH48263.1 hypothetical protein [Planctomycetaceae bacterium]
MEGTGCWGPENSLIRSFKIYDPLPNKGAIQIQRCDMPTGRVLWTRKITALVTSMTMINNNALAYGLTDGTLGVLDVLNGTVLFEECLAVDGISTIPTALAANGSQLAIGTIDGRLILGNLEM